MRKQTKYLPFLFLVGYWMFLFVFLFQFFSVLLYLFVEKRFCFLSLWFFNSSNNKIRYVLMVHSSNLMQVFINVANVQKKHNWTQFSLDTNTCTVLVNICLVVFPVVTCDLSQNFLTPAFTLLSITELLKCARKRMVFFSYSENVEGRKVLKQQFFVVPFKLLFVHF